MSSASALLPFRGRQSSRRLEDFRRPSLLWSAGILMLGVVPATLMDVPLARWIHRHPAPRWLDATLDILAFYGTPGGLAIVVVVLTLFLRRRRWTAPRLATLAAGGGAAATAAKLFVLRPRPNALPITSSAYDYAWIWSFDPTLSRVASFEPAMRAFPSSTLAMAAALTVGLWAVVPRLRWIGLVCCLGTMAHRLHNNAHFASDLFGSIAVGMTWAWLCFHPRLLGGVFDRLEETKRHRKIACEGDTERPEPQILRRAA